MQKYNNSIMFVCLICKRKFEDEEKLRKHEKFSDFHRVIFLFIIKKSNK